MKVACITFIKFLSKNNNLSLNKYKNIQKSFINYVENQRQLSFSSNYNSGLIS